MNGSEPLSIPWAPDAVRDRLSELVGCNAQPTSSDLARMVAEHRDHHRRRQAGSLALYAGSNIASPAVEAAHDSSIAVRPALGWPGAKVQPATQEIEALEVLAINELRRAFHARFAEPRFLTATLANLGVYTAFADPGETIAVLSPEAGNHASHREEATVGVRGLKAASLPYDPDRLDVDPDRLDEFMQHHRPRIIVVGGSVTQFPHDLEVLRAAADEHDSVLMVDASHVAGLIAAGVFPNPLDHGADVVVFSTYKTLAGPAGGATVTNDERLAERLAYASYPQLTSNYDPSRLGPLAIATAEAREQSPAWAQLTIDLARAVAQALHARGLTLVGAERGFTDTHQVVIDATALGGGIEAMLRLERSRVLSGACRIPRQDPKAGPAGIRIGLQEVVRLGATIEHAQAIAGVVADGLRRGDGSVAARTAKVRDSFGPDLWNRQSSYR